MAVNIVEVDNKVTVKEIEDPVNVTDNGGSLTVDGTVAVSNFPATQPVSGTVAVSNFPSAQPVTDNDGSLTVDGTVTANAGTGPWPVTDNDGSLTVDGTVSVSNFPATQPISAAALPLPSGAATAALQTQPGVDIGDVTINNAAGAAAVNVQDGGNSLTVDGTVTANAGAGPWPVTDNSGSLTVDSPQLPSALVGSRLDTNAGAWMGSTAPTVGQKTMAASIPVVLASDQSGGQITADQGTPNTQSNAWPVKLSNGTYSVDVTADGKLQVYFATPSAPPSGTAKSMIGDGNVPANSTSESIYTITSGKTLKIQRLSGGGENSVAGGRVELAYRPTGLAASDVLVEVGYISGGNFQFQLDENFIGDGTRQLVLKRINGGGGTMRITGKWVGYEI